MSVLVMSWVFQESEATQGARLVLLALADYAHDDGTKAFPAVESLARKARLSVRAAQYNLRHLEKGGAIERTGVTGRTGTFVYSVLMTKRGADLAGVQSATSGVQPIAPNPLEPPDQGGNAGGRALKVSGKLVNTATWERTMAILDDFNDVAGMALKPLTGAGQPSENAKRIYGRQVDWPELTVEQHRDIIERTLASKWWGDGAPSVGVVFGPKVFEENMTRKLSEKESKASGKARRSAEDRAAIQRIIDQQKGSE